MSVSVRRWGRHAGAAVGRAALTVRESQLWRAHSSRGRSSRRSVDGSMDGSQRCSHASSLDGGQQSSGSAPGRAVTFGDHGDERVEKAGEGV